MNRRRWPLLWTAWKACGRQCEALVVVTGEVFSGGSAYAGDTGTYLRVLAAANRGACRRADAVCEVACGAALL